MGTFTKAYSIKAIWYFIECRWQDFGSTGAEGVASVRRDQGLSHAGHSLSQLAPMDRDHRWTQHRGVFIKAVLMSQLLCCPSPTHTLSSDLALPCRMGASIPLSGSSQTQMAHVLDCPSSSGGGSKSLTFSSINLISNSSHTLLYVRGMVCTPSSPVPPC